MKKSNAPMTYEVAEKMFGYGYKTASSAHRAYGGRQTREKRRLEKLKEGD